MTRALAGLLACLACLVCFATACSVPLMKLPAGAGVPAADGVEALAQATAACRGIRTLTAEIAVSGSAAGRRVRVRMLAGVAAPASVRLEALAPFGAPVFIFAATNDDATLIFPRDERVLQHGKPDAVLDAVAGVPLDAADLVATLTGCAPAFPQASARNLGNDWRVVRLAANAVGYNLFLHRDRPAQPWRLVATTREGTTDAGWRAEYRDFLNDLPRTIRIAGVGPFDQPKNAAFDLTLALSQVETNMPLEADVFRPEIPSGADPITLEELRRARPGIREN